MAGKRKCPFGETSPQQFKTHIGQKEATRMNNDLMREVFVKTKNLLLAPHSKENTAPVPMTAPLPSSCQSCEKSAPSRSCSFCSKHYCSPCTRSCDDCQDVFCHLCSTVNYDMPQTRDFCLSCAPNF